MVRQIGPFPAGLPERIFLRVLPHRRIIAVLAMLLLSAFLFGDEEMAVLETGPLARKGLPFLSVNRIACFYGRYDWNGVKIEVYHTDTDFPSPRDAVSLECSGAQFLALTSDFRELLYRHDDGVDGIEWSLYFSFSESPERPCAFAGTFLRRFRFFLNSSQPEILLPPFPAVLQNLK